MISVRLSPKDWYKIVIGVLGVTASYARLCPFKYTFCLFPKSQRFGLTIVHAVLQYSFRKFEQSAGMFDRPVESADFRHLQRVSQMFATAPRQSKPPCRDVSSRMEGQIKGQATHIAASILPWSRQQTPTLYRHPAKKGLFEPFFRVRMQVGSVMAIAKIVGSVTE
ncbi:hypothetical protein A9K55_002042 [Cordyceps militaris]|uniref:Uncharacterized protein n=1 Tax=Cordyceps militaris TaxID=73501 RepID=A0A2H4SQY0_CORMI|nr:hypothetical protein A9K55_002042 [Cordyceps militaris]